LLINERKILRIILGTTKARDGTEGLRGEHKQK
jgi:hypothetical protein